MPKLDGTHILERLKKRIEQLEAGDEIADKEIRSLLNDAQRADLDGAWAQQQQLRKNKRARTEQEQQALGWKSKRQVRIEVLKAEVRHSSRLNECFTLESATAPIKFADAVVGIVFLFAKDASIKIRFPKKSFFGSYG